MMKLLALLIGLMVTLTPIKATDMSPILFDDSKVPLHLGQNRPAGHYCDIQLTCAGIMIGTWDWRGGWGYEQPWSTIDELDTILPRVCGWANTPEKDDLPKILIFNKREIWRSKK